MTRQRRLDPTVLANPKQALLTKAPVAPSDPYSQQTVMLDGPLFDNILNPKPRTPNGAGSVKKPAVNASDDNQTVAGSPWFEEPTDSSPRVRILDGDSQPAIRCPAVPSELFDLAVRNGLLHSDMPMEPYHSYPNISPQRKPQPISKEDPGSPCQVLSRGEMGQLMKRVRIEIAPTPRPGEATMMVRALEANPALKQKVLGKVGETRLRRVWNDVKKIGEDVAKLSSRMWNSNPGYHIKATVVMLVSVSVAGFGIMAAIGEIFGVIPFQEITTYAFRKAANIIVDYNPYEKAVYAKDVDSQKVEDEVIVQAAQIVQKDGALKLSQILDIYDWMGKNIEYLSVMEGHEPRNAALTLRTGKGDCKNMAALFAAMAISIGARVELVFTDRIGFSNGGYPYSHVYNGVRIATTNQKQKYDQIMTKVIAAILKRYPETNPSTIEFYQNSEGLWLPLDPTGASGYAPGVPPFKDKIVDSMSFGTKGLDMGLN